MLSFFHARLQLFQQVLHLCFHFVHFTILASGVISAHFKHVDKCTISNRLQKNVHIGQLKENRRTFFFTTTAGCKLTINAKY